MPKRGDLFVDVITGRPLKYFGIFMHGGPDYVSGEFFSSDGLYRTLRLRQVRKAMPGETRVYERRHRQRG